MAETLTALAYLAAAVLFILALRGLSHPDTARTGNVLGIAGMALAMITTALQPGMARIWVLRQPSIQAPIKFGLLFRGEPERLLIDGDTIPQLFDELDLLFRRWSLQLLVHRQTC